MCVQGQYILQQKLGNSSESLCVASRCKRQPRKCSLAAMMLAFWGHLSTQEDNGQNIWNWDDLRNSVQKSTSFLPQSPRLVTVCEAVEGDMQCKVSLRQTAEIFVWETEGRQRVQKRIALAASLLGLPFVCSFKYHISSSFHLTHLNSALFQSTVKCHAGK